MTQLRVGETDQPAAYNPKPGNLLGAAFHSHPPTHARDEKGKLTYSQVNLQKLDPSFALLPCQLIVCNKNIFTL